MSNINQINGLNITAESSSYAGTASLAPNYVLNSATSSMLSPYVLTSQTSSISSATASLALRASGSLTGSLLGTASWATNALTASFLLGSVTSASYAATASLAPNYVLNSATSSFITSTQTSSFVTNSQTSSFVLNSQTSSMTAGTASKVQGGTTNYIPLWSATTTLGSSVLYQNGTSIGLGTTSPNTNLHISASSAQPLLNIENATANGYSNMRFTGTGKKFVIGVGNASETTFGIANDFFIYDDSVGAVRAIMDTSGNIGVGTVSPGALLHVNGGGIIATSLALGTSSLGSTESTLVVGLPPAGGAGEGGQILLQASGGLYTSASMIDNYQNRFRILRGTNASSDGFKMQLDMQTGQMQLPNYNSQTAFTGTPVASLSVDSSGNILTVSSSVSVLHNKIGATFAGAASPTTRYHTIAGTIDTSATAVQVPLPVACTLNNFYFRTYGAQPAGGSLVVTLQKNGSDTAITVTIAAGSAAGNFTDTTNSVSFAAGDTWQIKLVQNAGTGTSTGIAGYSFKSIS